uniref:2'-5'-oligoadenylate synthetase 1 domain-containing protein n=1 Tax=Amphimedon queenslandica TaxID=400682 RepID=A0A1X7V266_AMPQE
MATIDYANRCVDELVRTFHQYLKEDTRLTPAEIIKGGSLGHGTAIPGDFDLDLVLYSRDIDPEVVLEIGVDNILDRLDVFLRRRLPEAYVHVKKTSFSLQFKLNGVIDVDLLPSPYWGEDPDQFHRFLEDKGEKERMKFSCSAAKWQVKFFKEQPNEVKEYIKRFKAWRNLHWPKGQDAVGRPKSYLLGLLMIKAYEKSKDKSIQSIERELKSMIHNHEKINIKWNDGYYDWTYRLTHEEFQSLLGNRFTLISSSNGVDVVYDKKQQRERTYTPAEVPSILDVANPFNDVYVSGIGNYHCKDPQGSFHPGTGKWSPLVGKIDTFSLSKPLEYY